jgi:hypothetical protein
MVVAFLIDFLGGFQRCSLADYFYGLRTAGRAVVYLIVAHTISVERCAPSHIFWHPNWHRTAREDVGTPGINRLRWGKEIAEIQTQWD